MNDLVPTTPGEVAAPKMRFRCDGCTREAGMAEGSYEAALDLLKNLGWRVGTTLICPGCLKEKARKFKRDYLEE